MEKKSNKKLMGGRLRGMDNNKRMVMPLLSNYSSRREWENACWRKIAGSKKLLQLFTTSHEKHNVVVRVLAIDGINSGKSYSQIGRALWLSPQTISSIKKSIDEKAYRSYSERSKKERKPKKYTTSIFPTTARPHGRLKRTKYGIIRMP